jgi:SAM-dependent methyltransferase
MSQTIKLQYGSIQPLLSEKMQARPVLSKWVNKILGYTNIGNYARSRVFKNQVSKLPLKYTNNILDLGCGYGEYSFMMARSVKHAKITALDIDPAALKNVRFAQNKLQLPNLNIYDGYLSTLPQSEFDLIYSVDVFEHIEEHQMPFADAYNKLRNGGFLMVKMPNITQSAVFPKKWFEAHEEWLKHEHPGQVYTLTDLKNRFEKEGFKIIFASQTDGILSRLAWELAYLMKKGGTILQLISLPICKALVSLDIIVTGKNTKNGNAITVIGQKI